jgi:hypothetical protein
MLKEKRLRVKPASVIVHTQVKLWLFYDTASVAEVMYLEVTYYRIVVNNE